MTRQIREPYLPDHEAFVSAEPPSGRLIVIAPTRAACETIELALGLHIETFLEAHYGERVRELARSRKGFGIVAGTGTGKTLAIRPIAEELLGTTELKVGVVNREREATPETPTWNVIIVTTGIARRWFEEGDILASDTLVVDEIHQTSAELELCLALGKRAGCRFIWLSATVDPTFYREYLDSADVLEVYNFDPEKAAKVRVIDKLPVAFLDDRNLQKFFKEKRGVAAFVPTRKGVEQLAEHVRESAPRINTAYYHGGEPVRILRPFLEGGEQKPFFLAMTAAGQSALNVQGLDTVIIDDKRFFNIIDRGRNVLTQEHLGANEILQMAGRVHGRVEGGRVFILSDRDIQFFELKPTAPEFQLAGDSERVAITCAALGVRADELDLPVPLDRVAYRNALELLESRAIVEKGRLTHYGRQVEAMPVERPWAELLVMADDDLVPFLAVMASVESLHRMTREERDLDGLIIPGSDHLTAYNVYAEAWHAAGRMGEVYGLPRHLFDEEAINEWAERRGVLVKAIEDAALGMASIYRSVGLPLPTEMPNAGERVLRRFQELLAQYMPFTLVIDEELPDGNEARVSKTSVCGSWGAIAGELRYFADKFGNPRASIEGTQVPMDLIRKNAVHGEPEVLYDPERRRTPLAIKRRVTYHGFELEREVEALDEIPAELLPTVRRALAEAMARHQAKHRAVERNRIAVEEVREVHRRSGGETPRLGQAELVAIYEKMLEEQQVTSLEEFRAANLAIDADQFVPEEVRQRYWALPDQVEIREKRVSIEYDVEEAEGRKFGVARLRLPEKLAKSLVEEELPSLDRPLRFVVPRGQRGAVRAATLAELREGLDQPWGEGELESYHRQREKRFEQRKQRKHEKHVREMEKDMIALSRLGKEDEASGGGSRGRSGGTSRNRGRGPARGRGGDARGGEARGAASSRGETRRGERRERADGHDGALREDRSGERRGAKEQGPSRGPRSQGKRSGSPFKGGKRKRR